MKIQKFKKFNENSNYKYNIGDYVLLDLDEVNKEWDITDDKGNFKIDASALITDLPMNLYEVIFSDDGHLHIRGSNIKRLLTPEEIEDYKTKKISHKYNI